MNVVLYMLTNAANEAAHEVAVIVPFGAALAARVLVPALQTKAGSPVGPASLAQAGRAGRGGRGAGRVHRRVRLRAHPAHAPPANVGLASWLYRHHLTYGLSGYWTSSSVTVNSGQQVKVRALMQYTLKPDLWMAKADWYNPKRHCANFVIMDSQPGNFSHWEPCLLVKKYFGASGPDVPSRPVHDHGVEQEPAQGPPDRRSVRPRPRSVRQQPVMPGPLGPVHPSLQDVTEHR